MGVLIGSETHGRGNDACRPHSGVEEAETPNGECDKDAEARRVATELVRLHKAGAIKSEQDASSYANLVHLFGASFHCSRGTVCGQARV